MAALSIDRFRIQTKFFGDGAIWLTKYGDIKHIINPAVLETVLYRKALWPNTAEKFSSGATLRMVSNVPDAIRAGITNFTNGVRQWKLLRDIPPSDLTIINRLKPCK